MRALIVSVVCLVLPATLVAQRLVAGWIHSENLRLLGGERISEAQRARVLALQAPGVGYEQQMVLELGGRQLWLRHALGHTGGGPGSSFAAYTLGGRVVAVWADEASGLDATTGAFTALA